jgi:hypothetical protein
MFETSYSHVEAALVAYGVPDKAVGPSAVGLATASWLFAQRTCQGGARHCVTGLTSSTA